MARVAALVVGELRNMHELVWRRHFIRTLHKLSAVYVSTWADQNWLSARRACHARTNQLAHPGGGGQLPAAHRVFAEAQVRELLRVRV